MTQRRNDPDATSNYFDRLYEGIGARGSSFSDLDAVSHDMATNRFLVQEFKRGTEGKLNAGQRWMLQGLAKIPDHFTVWLVRWRDDGMHDWADASDVNATYAVLTGQQLQSKFRAWWAECAEIAGRRVATTQRPVATPDMAAFCDAITADAEKKAS